MKLFIAAAIAVIISLNAVSAESFTAYTGDSRFIGEWNVTFTLLTKSDSGLAAAASAYSTAKKQNATNQDDLKNDTIDALTEAKRDDAVYVQGGPRSVLIPYKTCKPFESYSLCFTGVTYYEEDVNPLGDGRIDSVKIVDGETLLPFTLTTELSTLSLTAKRTLNASKVYPQDAVLVTVTVENTGTQPASAVSIADEPSVSVTSGKTQGYVGDLAVDGILQTQYTIVPKTAGTVVLQGSASSSAGSISLPDSTLEVLSPLTLTLAAGDAFLGEVTTANLTIKNTYRDELEISSLTFVGGEDYFIVGEYDPKESFSSITLDKDEEIFFLLGYKGSTAGAQTINAAVDYILSGSRKTATVDATYTRKTPTLVLTPVFREGIAGVVIYNDAPMQADGISIKFSDGFVQDLARLRAGKKVTVEHPMPVTEATLVTVIVTAPAAEGRAAFEQSFQGNVQPGGVVTVPGSEQGQAVVSVDGGEANAAVDEPEDTSTTDASTPTEEPPKKENSGFFANVVRGFVTFLEKIF